MSAPSHLAERELDHSKTQYKDFARTQLAHNITFGADSTFVTWLFQGVNTQTEHHLFPTVPFKYLPHLTPIIAEVSAKHGVDFPDPNITFWQAFGSFLKRIWRLSSPKETCVGGHDISWVSGDSPKLQASDSAPKLQK